MAEIGTVTYRVTGLSCWRFFGRLAQSVERGSTVKFSAIRIDVPMTDLKALTREFEVRVETIHDVSDEVQKFDVIDIKTDDWFTVSTSGDHSFEIVS